MRVPLVFLPFTLEAAAGFLAVLFVATGLVAFVVGEVGPAACSKAAAPKTPKKNRHFIASKTSLSLARSLPQLAYFIYNVGVMPGRDYLGEFEHLVLLALLRLGDLAYGVTVRQEIETRTGRDVSVGAVYTTLDRLEKKGYVTSSYGGATEERGGRSKRFFRITPEGLSAVNETQRALVNMTDGLRLRWS